MESGRLIWEERGDDKGGEDRMGVGRRNAVDVYRVMTVGQGLVVLWLFSLSFGFW